MKKTPIQLNFKNSQNPKAEFDLIRIQDVITTDYPNHSVEQLHLVKFYIILFIENGQGKHTIDFTDYDCKKGTILTIRKDQLHKFFKNKKLKGYLLLFTGDFLVSYLEKLEAQKSMQLFNESLGFPKVQLSQSQIKEVSNLIHRIKNEYFNINDEHSQGIIRSELQVLIAKLYRIKSQKDQVIFDRKYLPEFIEFQKMVEENVHKTNRVKDYAQLLGISTKTLNTITKTILHKTAKEFVDDICITQIKRLLINTELSIKEIAYATGFEETTNFYKYFKRQVQITPEQFRTTF